MKKTPIIAALFLLAACAAPDKDLKINDLEYYQARGVNVLVYSNSFDGGFNDEKNSGIEIIQHGVRSVQGGAIRLCNTPEQWDLVPKMTKREVNREDNSIEVGLRYEDYDFDSRIVVTGEGASFRIDVYLDEPVPEFLVGKAGLNLEFLPSKYWQKTYTMDGRLNRFPRYTASETTVRPNSEKPRQFKGYVTYDDRGTGKFVDALPLETGHKIIMAPEDPEHMVTVSSDSELNLFDGRIIAQNGWYVLRTFLPAGQTGKVVSWTVTPNTIENWVREPNIGFSQVGYVPEQPKVAVIELDPNDKVCATASLYKVNEDGKEVKAFTGKTSVWGRYYKYNYAKFDFSEVKEPGVYYIKYGDNKTGNFIIDSSVYDKITDATSDVWIPIHMNHMLVNEGYRVWHGEPFKEGYLQAPAPTDHFDLHSQGPATDTKYKALELIPGLNVGGYFDAGDFDIETGSNISVIQSLIVYWDLFKPMRDETFVDEDMRIVDLHRPDGIPDIIQYIKHGTLNIVAQATQIGHMSQTLSNSVLFNYHHLGDAAAITDGRHYDPRLKPYQISADGKSSGTPDDMWAFTSRNPGLDLRAAAVLEDAARVLAGYDDALAAKAGKEGARLRKEATELMKNMPRRGPRGNGGNWQGMGVDIRSALDSIPFQDAAFKESLRPRVEKYNEYLKSLEEDNPYGVTIGLGNWAGSGSVVSLGTTAALANKYFPDIVSKDAAYRAAAYMFGCHPYHNYSLVAAVGAARPKAVFYGNNRADFSFIPGNVAPGVLFRKPDHFENFDDWPFLWGQNEGTIAGNVGYLTFGAAFKNMVAN
ncbi:MAG: cellulase N-terminal Ig-like domain-containing protein [Bacteroidia bacterium]|nr:cellulase N-terminal Ig-like domain-containing protein [Bacteroidia bacterium]